MNGLLDFLQAASNSAAGTVSGPVDLIGMGLRKLGVPVPQNSLLSSEWMKQKGLMVDTPQNAASLAGETFGLLSPVVAAAKAPQIARGLLAMGENAAAPRALNPQTGAIVWHGSPHKFDKFDSSKIGTGEGAQAYGHGLYLAENPSVAGEYIRSGRNVGFENWDDVGRLADKAFAQANGDAAKAISLLDDLAAKSSSRTRQLNAALAKQSIERGNFKASLYKVDLPDSAIARMLDWDKPLSQQAPEVQSVLKDKFSAMAADVSEDGLYKRLLASGWSGDEARKYAAEQAFSPTGAHIVGNLGKGQDASNVLKRLGIPGIRYLDGGSRGAGSGTSNYVIFPGEESILKILERNGSPL